WLPFTSGPVSLFLALEQGTSFAAAAASGSIAGAAASALFAVVYAAVARRAGWIVSLAVASVAFVITIAILRLVPLGSGLPLPLLRAARVRLVLLRDRRANRPRRDWPCVRGSDSGGARGADADAAPAQDRSVALTDRLTLPLRAREIGQLSFAPVAASRNFAASAPGTSPVTSSALATTVQLSPTLSNVTFALTSSFLGGVPARASPADSAIAKHDACA